MRKSHSAEFKWRVGFSAATGQQTINELASKNSISPSLVSRWKTSVLTKGPSLFADQRSKTERDKKEVECDIYEELGRANMKLAWLEKKYALLVDAP
jgi:transposase-like protein